MSLSKPRLKFHDGWQEQLAEHRRVLLEKLIQEYPEVLSTKKSVVESWRLRLRNRDPANS
jgi:hypothetical protein